MLLFKFIFCLLVAVMQVASDDQEARELLVSALEELSELNDSNYCARFSGTASIKSADEPPTIRDIVTISAKHDKLEFHTWGYQTNLLSPFMDWNDALRDNQNLRKRFKWYTGGGAERHKDLELETPEQLKENAGNVWPWPELNPFGLVFGSESKMAKRYSDLNHSRDLIARFEFEESKQLQNGNRVGTWISPNRKTRFTIEFNRKFNNLPSMVKLEMIENKQLLGLTQTSWVQYGKNSYVPDKVSITSERDDRATVEYEFQWEWIPQDEWENWCEQKNFEKLFEKETLDFRMPFVDLFESIKKVR